MSSYNKQYRDYRHPADRVDKYSKGSGNKYFKNRESTYRGHKRKHEDYDTVESANRQKPEIIYTDEYGDWIVAKEAGPETAVKREGKHSIGSENQMKSEEFEEPMATKTANLDSHEDRTTISSSVEKKAPSPAEDHGQAAKSQNAPTLSDEDDSSHLLLNKLKGQIMKAEMMNSSDLESLRAEYTALIEKLDRKSTNRITVLDPQLQRLNAVKHSTEESSISEMVREELASRSKGAELDMQLARQINKDGGFENDEDYLVENAEKLSKVSDQKQKNLHNQLVNSTRAMNDAISNCSLCAGADQSPAVTVLSSATRVYLCLAPAPAIAKGVTCIVPFEHYRSTLDCDDDEWEEIRNYMKALTRMWNSKNKGVVFYENAISKSIKKHACIFAVPLPMDLYRSAPAFFNEAMMTSDDEWTVHRKVIDTAKKANSMEPEYAKYAFRTSVAKEASYFHVWFNINGGMCHIVENTAKWPPGDEFARQILGGMLQVDPILIRKKAFWQKADPAYSSLEPLWRKFDWVAAIQDGS